MTMQSTAIDIGGYQIAASRWSGSGSRGERAMVLLHAGVCDRRSWYRTAEQLTDLGPVIAYDRRGFGDSAVSPGPYRDLDDLWAVLDQNWLDQAWLDQTVLDPAGLDQAERDRAALKRPVWLVGSSMGGLLALDAALTSPERVAGLVLLAPAISGAPDDDDAVLDPASEALFEQLGAARQAGDLERRLELHTRIWLDGPAATKPRVTGPARDLALAMNAVILGHDVDDDAATAGVDAWSRLEQITVPTTVAWGDLDVPELIKQWQELVDRLPRARRQVLPGTAHLPYLERPGLVAAVIRATLD